MRVNPIYNDFSGGELSPRLNRRERTELYQSGLADTQNMICLLQGGAFFRAGSKRIAPAVDLLVKPRMIEFTTASDSYVLELSDLAARMHDGTTQIAITGSPPYTSDELFDVQYTQDDEYGMVFFHIDHPMQQLILSSGTFTWQELAVRVPQTVIYTPLPDSGGVFTLDLIDTWAGGDSFKLRLSGIQTASINWSADTTTMANRIESAVSNALREPEANIFGSVTVSFVSGTLYEMSLFDEFGDMVGNDITVSETTTAGDGTVTLATDTAYAGDGVITETAWNATNGYPRTGAFWRQRLVVGGTYAEPAHFMASRIGDPMDFITGVEADDPVRFRLKADKRADIRVITATDVLTFGTQSGDFILQGSISADVRFDVDRYTSVPAKSFNAIELSGRAAYLQSDGRKLRVLEYSDEIQKWTSHDATFRAEHITGAGITDITVTSMPDQIAFACREDGGFLAFAFDTDQKVAAWSKLHTSGPVGTVCARHSGETDEVWIAVERTSGWQIECIPQSSMDFYSQVWTESGYARGRILDTVPYLDSYVTATNTDTITDLDHMVGKTAKVLVDGAYLGEFLILTPTLVLDDVYVSIIVGLPYTGRMQTLPPTIGNPAGTAQASIRRWSGIHFQVIDSVMPIINGRREFTETAGQVMGDAPELLTGTYTVDPDDTDEDGRVLIEHDSPYPLHVVAIWGDMVVGNN